MALKNCPECSKEVSSDAAQCPHCGKKLRMGLLAKTLLTAGALAVLFIGYGMSIPDNVANANSARRYCEKEMMPRGLAVQYNCDRLYDEALKKP